ncbi:MAG: hypothetical protein SFZ23_08725 [Planctomycetota bacterium]|nr:hypothetical protein [Planctomycetota bacterium]
MTFHAVDRASTRLLRQWLETTDGGKTGIYSWLRNQASLIAAMYSLASSSAMIFEVDVFGVRWVFRRETRHGAWSVVTLLEVKQARDRKVNRVNRDTRVASVKLRARLEEIRLDESRPEETWNEPD